MVRRRIASSCRRTTISSSLNSFDRTRSSHELEKPAKQHVAQRHEHEASYVARLRPNSTHKPVSDSCSAAQAPELDPNLCTLQHQQQCAAHVVLRVGPSISAFSNTPHLTCRRGRSSARLVPPGGRFQSVLDQQKGLPRKPIPACSKCRRVDRAAFSRVGTKWRRGFSR